MSSIQSYSSSHLFVWELERKEECYFTDVTCAFWLLIVTISHFSQFLFLHMITHLQLCIAAAMHVLVVDFISLTNFTYKAPPLFLSISY